MDSLIILIALAIFVPPKCDAFLGGLTTVFARGYKNIYCRFVFCCTDKNIKLDIEGLWKSMESKVYGQHLVARAVTSHIKGHLTSSQPQKALILSFHGSTGTGKNLVSRIIAESIYKRGMKSPFVHLISATKDFPHMDRVPHYKEQLQSWIQGNVSKCGKSMFIFDEVDKLPAKLLDAIKPYADYHEHLGGVDYRRTIFIFLSNSGGLGITNKVFQHWKSGSEREKLQLRDLENEIMLSAVNTDTKTGLWHSQLISSHLITAFIPFLPLERQHVRMCIRDSLVGKTHLYDNEEQQSEIEEEVLEELIFSPEDEQTFSITGCKRVVEKLDFVTMDRQWKKSEL